MKKVIVPLLMVGALSACGGSSTGSVASQSFTSLSALPANGQTAIKGKALTTSYTANLDTGAVEVGASSGLVDSTVFVTTEGGFTVAETITTPGSSTSFDTRNGGSATDGSLIGAGDVILAHDASGSNLVAQADTSKIGNEYQDYGVWLTGFGEGSGTVGVTSVGAVTDIGGIPTGTVANLSGTSIGLLNDAMGGAYLTSSVIDVSTDFNTVNVNSSLTSKFNIDSGVTSSATNLDFSGSGSVSGNTFTMGVGGADISGDLDGSFYGPAAQEAGGVFYTGGNGNIYVGSFGAN